VLNWALHGRVKLHGRVTWLENPQISYITRSCNIGTDTLHGRVMYCLVRILPTFHQKSQLLTRDSVFNSVNSYGELMEYLKDPNQEISLISSCMSYVTISSFGLHPKTYTLIKMTFHIHSHSSKAIIKLCMTNTKYLSHNITQISCLSRKSTFCPGYALNSSLKGTFGHFSTSHDI
jgi:hypothetical protein